MRGKVFKPIPIHIARATDRRNVACTKQAES